MPTPSTRTPVRIARGSYSNLNGSISDLQDGEISYAEDQNKLYVKEGSSLVALTFTPADPAFTGTITGVNLTLSGNLTVNGTTTTINTQTLDVEDKNIVIGNVSSPSDTTAQGGGITLKGASDKDWSWGAQHGTGGSWISNQNIFVPDNKRFIAGSGDDISIYHDSANAGARIENITGELHIKNTTANSIKLVTNNAVRLTIDGAGVATFTGSVSDSKGNLRTIPRELKGSAYTLVAADAGKCIVTDSGVTVPHNILGTGDAVTIINNSGSDITITQASSLTMHNSADASSGNRTLAGKGMATVWFSSGAEAYISGAGLS